MATFQKIPIDQWKQLSQDEKDWHTLHYQESLEKRQLWIVVVTRCIAVFFIIALIQMGYTQLQSVRAYEQKLDELGTMGFCALCGEYNLKKCECQYAETYNFANEYQEQNLTRLAEELSAYNALQCPAFEVYQQESIENLTKLLDGALGPRPDWLRSNASSS